MKLDKLARLKRPGEDKSGMMLAIGIGKKRPGEGSPEEEGMESSKEEGDEEKSDSLSKFSSAELLDELHDRDCLEDAEYSKISDHIASKEGDHHSSSDMDMHADAGSDSSDGPSSGAY